MFDCVPEIVILKNICKSRKDIIRCVDVLRECSCFLSDCIGLKLDYYEKGSLEDYKITSDVDKNRCIESLVSAVKFLHSRCILHLDIKPSNILVSSLSGEPRFVLTDFSVSRRVKSSIIVDKPLISVCYRPYVNLKGSLEYSYKSDLWSVGIIINEIISGCNFEENIMKVNINGYPPLESSIIVHIERQKAWNLWPPTQPYSEFLEIPFTSLPSPLISKGTHEGTSSFTSKGIFDSYNLSTLDQIKMSLILSEHFEEVNNLYKRLTTMQNNEGYIFSFLVIASMYGHSYVCVNLIQQNNNPLLKSYIDSLLVILKSIDYEI